jgi:histidine triad (HIT) family protein
MENCVFCSIVAGKIPGYKIYEDERILAFLDISPVNYGHALVIPKKHAANLEEISEEDLMQVIIVVKKIGRALISSLGVSGYNVIENNNKVSGQLVPHLHFHIIPRLENDGLRHWPGGEYAAGEAEIYLEKIKSFL